MKVSINMYDHGVMLSLHNTPAAINAGSRKGLYYYGLLVAGRSNGTNDGIIRREMNAGKSGRLYKVYKGIGGARLKNPRLHRASAPGESPAVVTGELRKETNFAVFGLNRLVVGNTKEYSRILEDGGNTGRSGKSYIAPRKYIYRSLSISRQMLVKYIISNIVVK